MVKMAYENLPERWVHHWLDGRLNFVVFSTALLSPHRRSFGRLRFSRYAISAVPLGALARVKPGSFSQA